jgi:predicted acylesterase/phospholipase RssA/CRP-like cAMP-binding protein
VEGRVAPGAATGADAPAGWLRAFAAAELFSRVASDDVEALAAAAEPQSLRARDWLFRAGDAADRLFVVVSGRLRVVVETDEGERVLRIVGPGALLGELGVLTESPRSASVQAIRDSTVAALDAERFLAALRSSPELGGAIATSLARLLQQSGGLLPPAAVPAVFGVVPLGSTRAVADLVDDLRRSFERLGSVAVLTASDAPDPHARAGAVDTAERHHEHVLLIVGDGAESDPDWEAFVARQSDVTLVVADAGASPPARADLRGAQVAFAGTPRPGTVDRWLDAFGSSAHHIVARGDGEGVDRVVRRLTGRALGVVLSGGGARGFAHIGALEVLADAGFAIDRVGGCSIGSFIGAMAASGWGAGRIARVCEDELVRRSPFSDFTLPRVSLIRARRFAAMLSRVFGETHVEELPRPFFAVSADLIGSRLVVHRRGPLLEAVAASMSIPGLAPPLPLGAQLLVDGGVLNNLPVDRMDESDEGPIVAIDVIRRLEGEGGDAGDRAVPTITEILARATVLASVERAENNRKLATLTITPDVQSIALREFSQLRKAVDEGRRAASEALASGGAEGLRDALRGPSPADA